MFYYKTSQIALINNNSSLDLRRKKIYNFFPLKLLKLFKIFLSLYSDHTKLIKISFEIYEKIISGYVLAQCNYIYELKASDGSKL